MGLQTAHLEHAPPRFMAVVVMGATKFTDLRTSLIANPPDGKMSPYIAAT